MPVISLSTDPELLLALHYTFKAADISPTSTDVGHNGYPPKRRSGIVGNEGPLSPPATSSHTSLGARKKFRPRLMRMCTNKWPCRSGLGPAPSPARADDIQAVIDWLAGKLGARRRQLGAARGRGERTSYVSIPPRKKMILCHLGGMKLDVLDVNRPQRFKGHRPSEREDGVGCGCRDYKLKIHGRWGVTLV